ncbi:MAG TPA: hypothetical protein VFU05_02695, partial [Cyclobacteriaceae bacterium]|nr:hypothetical protein [Cyclobacteriaceae bacterium]
MQKEITQSPEESLRLIADAISRTKESLRENSFPFLLWGWLIAIASFLFFFLHQFTSFQLYFVPFPFLAIAGVITTILYYKKRNSTSTITYVSNFLSNMWLALG